jgi:hypothetical protein
VVLKTQQMNLLVIEAVINIQNQVLLAREIWKYFSFEIIPLSVLPFWNAIGFKISIFWNTFLGADQYK